MPATHATHHAHATHAHLWAALRRIATTPPAGMPGKAAGAPPERSSPGAWAWDAHCPAAQHGRRGGPGGPGAVRGAAGRRAVNERIERWAAVEIEGMAGVARRLGLGGGN